MKKSQNIVFSLILLLSSSALADVNLGPFILKGFLKQQAGFASPICHRCAVNPDEDRQRWWADAIRDGADFGPRMSTLSLIHLYLNTKKFEMGNGYKISGTISQRWRDYAIDIPGVLYDANVLIEQDYYGSLQLGNFVTRGWGIADFPYGSHVGLADAWGASGSGYGILTRAARYALPVYDLFEGDFRIEYTRDFGEAGFKVLKPEFHEVWLQYVRNGVIVDFFWQLGINGIPGSWTHGPFRGITNEVAHEEVAADGGAFGNQPPLEQNRQSILMLMTHFPINNATFVYAGVRHNRWSGANPLIVDVGGPGEGDELWNNMFNVNWAIPAGNAEGVPANPDGDDRGYPASSTDAMIGFRYRPNNRWTFSTGWVYLGEAETDNPLERGQSNAAIFGGIGGGYSFPSVLGLSANAGIGFAFFKEKGLAPLSMPAHTAFSGVDPRVSTFGAGITLEIEYVI